MKFTVVLTALFCVVCAPLPAQFQSKDFDEAARRIQRRSPSGFAELPDNIAGELQKRGCTIPQEVFTKRASNVIRGEFAKSGQTDWAVLCSVRGFSTILVFWNGSEKNPSAVARLEDRIFLQSINATEIGFSRGISAVSEDFIRGHCQPTAAPSRHRSTIKASMMRSSKRLPWSGTSIADNG